MKFCWGAFHSHMRRKLGVLAGGLCSHPTRKRNKNQKNFEKNFIFGPLLKYIKERKKEATLKLLYYREQKFFLQKISNFEEVEAGCRYCYQRRDL